MPRRTPITVPRASDRPDRQYRYWGARKPPEHRDPVRAQVVSNDDGAGTATIRLYDPIDSWGGIWGVSATEFAQALDELDASVNTIELHLNSPGGEVYEGIAILNLLRQHPADVTAVVDGLAASAASFIACGVDQTLMAPNSQLMIHDAWGICIGPAADMHGMGDLLDKISGNIAAVYQDKAGTGTDWRAAMLAETWYNADEAVAAGLADALVGDVPDDAENAFDLSIFKHQGRADAPAPPPPSDDSRPRQLACGCGADIPGVQHKDGCTARDEKRLSVAQAKHRLNARRRGLPAA